MYRILDNFRADLREAGCEGVDGGMLENRLH